MKDSDLLPNEYMILKLIATYFFLFAIQVVEAER
jgi:hypothetical protein